MELSKFEIRHAFGYHCNPHARYALFGEKFYHSDNDYHKGGYTITYDPTLGVAGVAVCSPGDQYSRKKGVLLALNRMLLAAGHRQWNNQLGVTIAVPSIHGGKVAQQLRRAAIMDAVGLMDDKVWVWGTMTLLEQ
jgi:hypothetical protein